MIKKRIENLQNSLEKTQAILITDANNRFYFTGFRSSAGALLITKEKSYFFIDFRYFEKAKQQVSSSEVLLSKNLYSEISEILKLLAVDTLLLENTITVSFFEQIKLRLENFKVNSDKELTKKIIRMRSIKTEKEIAFLKEAQRLTDETFSYILDRIKEGTTEKEIMLDMEFFIRKQGSEGVAFDFIVVSGKNSSLPHGVPTDKKIESGDFITMDFGAVINGYRSDMTRTVAVGSITEKQKEVYETVLKAQKRALDFIKPDVECCTVDKIARDIIANAGYGDCFGHGLGHSVGLDIHENPACNTRDKTILKSGMIMTVEPGIYIENEFGVRIEDMVAVTENGHCNLTKSPKQLIIL